MKTELGISIPGPAVSESDVAQMCHALAGRGWIKANVLCALLEVDDRVIRAIASASKGRIISGQNGYLLFDSSTAIGDADRAACKLEAQAKAELNRAREIRLRIHRYAREVAA